ncbi:hypothetical protein, partial [Nocardia gipuzkoensis]
WLASERPPLATSSRTRRPLGREPGRERRMLGLASLETWDRSAPGTLTFERRTQRTRLGAADRQIDQ